MIDTTEERLRKALVDIEHICNAQSKDEIESDLSLLVIRLAAKDALNAWDNAKLNKRRYEEAVYEGFARMIFEQRTLSERKNDKA
jgi:hypothetical protein